MRKFLIFFLILAVVGGMIVWKNKAEKPTDIYIETAKEQDIRDTILASGNLTFDTQIQLRSEVTGTVKRVWVVEGDRVKKDQLLLEVNATTYQTDVDSRQAQVAARNIEIERVSASQQEMLRQFTLKKRLYSKKLLGKDEYERVANQLRLANIEVKAAKVRLEQDLAALTLAKDKLAKTQIRATMDGLIANVSVKEGETVADSSLSANTQPLLTLANPDLMLAELKVDEADIANVEIGQVVRVFTAAAPKDARLAKVTRTGVSAKRRNTGSLYFDVRAQLDSPEGVYPGMSFRAEIQRHVEEAKISVPISAIQSDGDQHFVWVYDGGGIKKQQVTLGLASDTHQVITHGLKSGTAIVTGPARSMATLSAQSVVRVKAS